MILNCVFAVLTTLVGQIYDQQTGNGLPNMSVYLSGTQVGTSSNAEGYFFLRTDISRTARVVVSGIGYQTHRFTLQPGQDVGIDIPMQEKNTQLADVFVSPGANPALPLMERVRQARQQNDVEVSSEPDYRTQLYLSSIQARHLKRNLWRSLQGGMILSDDSTYLLPLYSQQCTNGHKSTQTALMTESDYAVLLADLDQPVNFYRNTINFYSTSFLSPLAADGNRFYSYYLADSTETAKGKCYTVHFKTRNPYYNTFSGELVIDSLTAALVQVSATVPREVNANYLQHLSISQSFDSVQHTLQSESLSLLLDFAIKADTSRTFPTVLVQNTKQYLSLPTPPASTNPLSPNTYNLSPKNYTGGLTPCVVDTAIGKTQDVPLMRVARWLAYVVQRAYVPTGTNVEIGNVSEIIHLNPQELVRVGLPLRTSPTLWKNVCLEAYAACGVKDHAWKGAGSVYWNLPTQRRHFLQVRYADEYIYSEISDFDRLMRENAVWSPQMGITTALMKPLYRGDNTYNSMVRQREGRVQWDGDWTDMVETQTRLSVGRMGYTEPTHDYRAQPSYMYAKLAANVRLSWQEKKVDWFCHRHHVYNHLPVVYVGGEVGSYELDSRQQYDLYGKLQLMVRHHQPLGAGGELDYMLEGGVILGAVPYTLLNIFDGNQSYAYDPYRFTLMHNYQYAADRYVLLHADWNGQGCLFNLIPGWRVLRLRELVSFKLAYGGLSSKHAERLGFPEDKLKSLSVPYVEVGVGLGNILRIADLMSVWRLTHRQDPGAPVWSMRFRFHIDS